MTEHSFLSFFLGVAFLLAPLMTNFFFLKNSQFYSVAHKICLGLLLVCAIWNLPFLSGVWLVFCLLGSILFLKQEGLAFSVRQFAILIPFIFSIISATWFFFGVNDLYLLGYNRVWSFYAALHGSFLGWLFVGCLAFLAKREGSSRFYLFGCYLSLILFLFVAFGIDGIPYLKRVGVIGFSVLVPFSIGHYFRFLEWQSHRSRCLAGISLLSITVSMALALLNEFWTTAPRFAFGLPIMVVAHGLLNALLTMPCFLLAIYLEEFEKEGDLVKKRLFSAK